MLFKQVHIGHRHATVHGFAHVINREEGYLHGGEGFHLKRLFEQHPEGLVGQNLDSQLRPSERV